MSVELELVFEYEQHNSVANYIYQVRYVDNFGASHKLSGVVSKDQAIEKVSFKVDGSDVLEVTEKSFLVELPNADISKMITCRMGALHEGSDTVHNVTGWVGTTTAPDSEPHPQFSTIYKRQV